MFLIITKDHESVLTKILEISKSPGVNIDIPYSELETTFSLPTNDVQAAIASLNKNNLIRSRPCVGDVSIYVLPDAFGYFSTKQESEAKAKHKKWDDRRWNIIQASITGTIGFVFGVLAMWVKVLIWGI